MRTPGEQIQVGTRFALERTLESAWDLSDLSADGSGELERAKHSLMVAALSVGRPKMQPIDAAAPREELLARDRPARVDRVERVVTERRAEHLARFLSEPSRDRAMRSELQSRGGEEGAAADVGREPLLVARRGSVADRAGDGGREFLQVGVRDVPADLGGESHTATERASRTHAERAGARSFGVRTKLTTGGNERVGRGCAVEARDEIGAACGALGRALRVRGEPGARRPLDVESRAHAVRVKRSRPCDERVGVSLPDAEGRVVRLECAQSELHQAILTVRCIGAADPGVAPREADAESAPCA